MNGAELDTRRRALGLSVGEAAAVCDVSERQFSYWVSGDGAPRNPTDIVERMTALENAMGDVVDHQIEAVEALEDGIETVMVPLMRYRTQAELDASPHAGLPLGAHAMMISWLADDLRREGHEVTISWVS